MESVLIILESMWDREQRVPEPLFFALTCSVGDSIDQTCCIRLYVGLVQIHQARHFDCGHLKLNF